MRKLWMAIGIVIGLLMGGVTLAVAQGLALSPGTYDLEEGQYVFNVPALGATAVPATNTPIPLTDTAVPPSATPVPPSATPIPSGHNDRAWHPLTEEFAHEHKADPRELDDVFGTEFFDLAGGEISYPWQTPNENVIKHEGYGWLVERDVPRVGLDGPFDQYVSDYRVQYHGIVSAVGAVTRFHSFALEARLCDEPSGICGNILTGGHLDYGNLQINNVHSPLPGDNPLANNGRAGRGQRSHVIDGFEIWYSNDPKLGGPDDTAHRLAKLTILFPEPWGPLNPADPFELNFYCPDFQCNSNNSRARLHDLTVFLDNPALDPDGNGIIDFDGYTDRFGVIVSGCSAPSLDCVPLLIDGIPVGIYRVQEASGAFMEGDTSPPGEFWIESPN